MVRLVSNFIIYIGIWSSKNMLVFIEVVKLLQDSGAEVCCKLVWEIRN